MDKGISKIAWPGVGYDEPKIFGNASAFFFKYASNVFLRNTLWVVFAVEIFSKYFLFLGFWDFSSFWAVFGKSLERKRCGCPQDTSFWKKVVNGMDITILVTVM